MPEKTFDAYSIADLRELARRRLPKGLFEFVDRGTEDDVAVRNNRAAFERIKLRPSVLRDVSKRSRGTTVFGNPQSLPIAIAPTGSAGLMWHNGEIALARAAARAGIPCTIATGAMTAIEQIADAAHGCRLWFQLYMWPARKLSHQLVARAKAAGYEGLVVTVDSPVPPGREYNLHNGFTIPFSLNRRNAIDMLTHPRWLISVLGRYMATTGIPRYQNYPSEVKNRITALPMGRSMMLNDSLTWDDLRELRKLWPHRLMVKGIMTAADAASAVDCGVDGVIISNHGGRVLDCALAPIDVLPEVVEAVGKRTTVIIDSGFRRGSDIVKALALGAQLVLIGRATLYGTAVGGEAGATRAINLLGEEFERTLALIGCSSIEELSARHVILPKSDAAQ